MSALKDYIMKFVGTPYKWAGSNPISGFDCSGFVQECLASVGIDPAGDQTAQALYNHFKKVGKEGERGLGALCFYGNIQNGITHITIMIDENLCVGANGGGSATKLIKNADDQNAFIKMRPYNYRKDLIAVIMPNYSVK